MWIPDDTATIEAAIARGDLVETSSFDGKLQLPATPKQNPSLAVDVAAMSTAGGVLLYGVGEDANEHLTIRAPIDLVGAADRVAQIVQTSIAEVPHIEFRTYLLPDDSSKGYLLVVVPPSPRAPHQVTVGGDLRFYGRGAKGNRRLTEQEVALLYARRQQQAVTLNARMDEVLDHARFRPVQNFGYLYAFAQPVPPSSTLWDSAIASCGGRDALLARLGAAAARPSVRGGHDPNFQSAARWHALGADAWRLWSGLEPKADDEDAPYLAEITLNVDGRAVLFSGNAAQHRANRSGEPDSEGYKYIFESVIAANLSAFFALMSEFFETAGYFGPVDCGLAVTGLDGGRSTGRVEGRDMIFRSQLPTFNAQTYPRARQLAAASELADADGLALAFLGRLFEATTGRDNYNPFGPLDA
jgi:hypothetical protein